MIPLFTLKGYSKTDPLDLVGSRARYIIHILVTAVITGLLVYVIDDVLQIVKFKSLWVKVVEVVWFGFIFAPLLIALRKSSSVFLYLLILAPLYPFDLYLEHHVRPCGAALWDYYPGTFVSNINPPALRFFITISVDGLLIGPLCLFISRLTAHGINKAKGSLNEKPTLDEHLELFSKGLTKDDTSLGKRGFDFWVLRLLGIVYFVYFSLLLIGSLGSSPWPASLAELFDMTYANPVHGINTFGKISVMTLLAFHAAFNREIRWFCVLVLFIGHINSTLFSFIFYVNNPAGSVKDFLLASALADGAMVVLFLIVLIRSKKAIGASFNRIKGIPEHFSLPMWMNTLFFYTLCIASWLYVGFMIMVRFSGSGSFFANFKFLYENPDPMLANSLTLFVALGLLSLLGARWSKLKDYLIGAITDPMIIMLIIGLVWFLLYRGNPAGFNSYFIWFLLVTFSVLLIVFTLRRLGFNTDHRITAMHPSEALAIRAAIISFYGEENVNAYEGLKKTDLYMGNIRGRKRGLINFPFWVLENLLPPILALRPRFSCMSEDERSHFLRRYVLKLPAEMTKSFIPPLSKIAFMLGTSIKAIANLAHFTTQKGKNSIGYVAPELRDRFKTYLPLQTPPFTKLEKLPIDEKDPLNYKPSEPDPGNVPASRTTAFISNKAIKKEYDYVIIGSGPGGATAAYKLAQQGNVDKENILIVERGSRYSPIHDMNDDELDMLAKLYKEGGLQQTKNFDMTVLQGEAFGGTSVINNAVCFEMTDNSRQTWENDHGLDLSTLSGHYRQIQKELNIHPLDDKAINQKVKAKFLKGVNGYNSHSTEQLDLLDAVLVNARNEIGDGLWNLGNKRRRKLSMLDTYLPWAEGLGVQILDNTNVLRFNHEGHKAKEILVQLNTGELTTIKINKALIIAGGVIASSHLIMRSGITKNVGQGLCCNYAFPMAFTYDDKIDAFDGTQITMAALDPKERAVFETYFNPPGAYSITVPFNFDTNRKIMGQYAHSLSMGALIGSENTGKIHLKASPLTGRAFSWQLSQNDTTKIKYAFETLLRIGKHSGANSAILPTRPGVLLELQNENQLSKFLSTFEKYPLQMKELIMSTAHPQGGNAMGASENSVVDENFKLRGCDNVFVTDASVFPTSLGVNPQWTIMAMSALATEKIASEFG